MRATVAEPQGDAREGGAERSGRRIRGLRNTNWQRGRRWATSMLVNAKSNPHIKTPQVEPEGMRRKFRHLTRGGLQRESAGEVSSGHSNGPANRGLEDTRSNYETDNRPVKDQRNHQQGSTEHCVRRNKQLSRQQPADLNGALCEPHRAQRCSRLNRSGASNPNRHA